MKKLNESNAQLNAKNVLGHGVWHLIQGRHVIGDCPVGIKVCPQ